MKQLNICIALLTAAALLLTGCAGNREKGGETTGTAEAGQQETEETQSQTEKPA